jgi:hypothetical protein
MRCAPDRGITVSNGGDLPIEVPPVTTPDLKETQKLANAGTKDSGIIPYAVSAFFSMCIDGLQKILTILAGLFDDIAALLTNFFTAAQGQDTPGFNNLVAAVLEDTLGVPVDASDLQSAQFQSGRVGAMKAVGAALFNTLGNEFVTGTASDTPGGGDYGLPGAAGTRLTPQQGVAAAQSFIGFALSFAVRQGNVAFLSSALPWQWLGGIREYGEMMAKNLGLGRLVRRALQPYVQTLIAGPLQEALNRQYRPHVMDAKQLASAYIRSDIDQSDYRDRLQGLGYRDADIQLLIEDTYTRVGLHHIFILQDNGFLSDSEAQSRITALGFNSSDVGLLRSAHDLEAAQRYEREYVAGALADLHAGVISQDTFTADIDALALSTIEKNAIKKVGANRVTRQRKVLSLAWYKKAYLDGTVTIDEVLTHMKDLGFTQDAADVFEVELLLLQSEQKTKAAAKAKAAAAKAAKGTASSTPPVA